MLYPEGHGDELLADTDRATGIVRVHFAYDAFKRLLSTEFSSLTERDQISAAAISHEGMHVLQMMNTGFAYELSLQCFQHVARAWRDHRGDLDQIYHHPHQYTAELEPVMDTLLTSSSDGVSALDLLEASAYLFEKRIHFPVVGPRGFEEMLAGDVPDDVYIGAYNLATDALGDDAFDQFIHVATLALQTREPHAVFRPLLEEFRDSGSRSDLLHNHRIGLKLLNSRYADVLEYGWVGDWRGDTVWSVSSPRPSNRACGSPAHGSPTPFTGGVRRVPARPGWAWVRRRCH